MNEEQKKQVYAAIKKHGDSFWQDEGQEYLFDDIVEAVEKEGQRIIILTKEQIDTLQTGDYTDVEAIIEDITKQGH